MKKLENDWGLLLDKYVREELTPEEKEELDHQIKACPIKQRQFNERTDPVEFMKKLEEVYNINSEKSWENLEKKLPFKKKQPSGLLKSLCLKLEFLAYLILKKRIF